MRFVYHLTKDGAFLGPGSMFVFAGFLMLVASGCAFALPKERRIRGLLDADQPYPICLITLIQQEKNRRLCFLMLRHPS
jgi:hypothetical protein